MVKAKGAAVRLRDVFRAATRPAVGTSKEDKHDCESDDPCSERIRCLKANEGGLKTSLDADCVTP